jgi:excisionase family DNA binding protein
MKRRWRCITVSKQPNQQSAFAPAVNGEFEPLLDSEQAAALIRIHAKTLQRMARNGEITGIRVGKLWRFRASALNRWLEKIAS